MTTSIFLLLTLAAAIFLSAAMSLGWMIQQRSGNSGWVDAVWTFSLGIAGVGVSLAALVSDPASIRPWIVAAFVAAWSARLGLHIVQRTRHMDNDPRYAKMAEDWGSEAPRRMFRLLQIQAAISILLVLSIAVAAWNIIRPIGWQDGLAIAIFLIAITGEAIADAQLQKFAKNPANRGKVCSIGLWRWSRHPNYFFEWLVWLGVPIFAINLYGTYHWGVIAIIAPVCMYYLLTRVSGIPLLEDHMERKYGDPYRRYQRTTSAFFPLPPTN